jgi:hypothetical protein
MTQNFEAKTKDGDKILYRKRDDGRIEYNTGSWQWRKLGDIDKECWQSLSASEHLAIADCLDDHDAVDGDHERQMEAASAKQYREDLIAAMNRIGSALECIDSTLNGWREMIANK